MKIYLADGRGHREARNIAVGDDDRIFDFLTEASQAATQDDAHLRLTAVVFDHLFHVGGCLADVLQTLLEDFSGIV
ncbi:MAG: hypothetical protein II383_01655 [Bacteroidales bacterium]|nr:hypothetical protein [Bacteroidales bacterium]